MIPPTAVASVVDAGGSRARPFRITNTEYEITTNATARARMITTTAVTASRPMRVTVRGPGRGASRGQHGRGPRGVTRVGGCGQFPG
jgi:hypothetical protein